MYSGLIIRHWFQSVKMQPGIIRPDSRTKNVKISVFTKNETPLIICRIQKQHGLLLVKSTCIVYPRSRLKNYLEKVSIVWRQPSQWLLHRNPPDWYQWRFRWPTLILYAVVVTSHISFLFCANSLVSNHHKSTGIEDAEPHQIMRSRFPCYWYCCLIKHKPSD